VDFLCLTISAIGYFSLVVLPEVCSFEAGVGIYSFCDIRKNRLFVLHAPVFLTNANYCCVLDSCFYDKLCHALRLLEAITLDTRVGKWPT
jgi:hypothetical protein